MNSDIQKSKAKKLKRILLIGAIGLILAVLVIWFFFSAKPNNNASSNTSADTSGSNGSSGGFTIESISSSTPDSGGSSVPGSAPPGTSGGSPGSPGGTSGGSPGSSGGTSGGKTYLPALPFYSWFMQDLMATDKRRGVRVPTDPGTLMRAYLNWRQNRFTGSNNTATPPTLGSHPSPEPLVPLAPGSKKSSGIAHPLLPSIVRKTA